MSCDVTPETFRSLKVMFLLDFQEMYFHVQTPSPTFLPGIGLRKSSGDPSFPVLTIFVNQLPKTSSNIVSENSPYLSHKESSLKITVF